MEACRCASPSCTFCSWPGSNQCSPFRRGFRGRGGSTSRFLRAGAVPYRLPIPTCICPTSAPHLPTPVLPHILLSSTCTAGARSRWHKLCHGVDRRLAHPPLAICCPSAFPARSPTLAPPLPPPAQVLCGKEHVVVHKLVLQADVVDKELPLLAAEVRGLGWVGGWVWGGFPLCGEGSCYGRRLVRRCCWCAARCIGRSPRPRTPTWLAPCSTY